MLQKLRGILIIRWNIEFWEIRSHNNRNWLHSICVLSAIYICVCMLSLNTHMYLCMYLVYSGLTTTYNLNSAKSPSHTRTTSRRSTDGSALSGGIRVRGGFGEVDGDGFGPPFALRTRGVRGSRLCQRQIWLDHLTHSLLHTKSFASIFQKLQW